MQWGRLQPGDHRRDQPRRVDEQRGRRAGRAGRRPGPGPRGGRAVAALPRARSTRRCSAFVREVRAAGRPGRAGHQRHRPARRRPGRARPGRRVRRGGQLVGARRAQAGAGVLPGRLRGARPRRRPGACSSTTRTGPCGAPGRPGCRRTGGAARRDLRYLRAAAATYWSARRQSPVAPSMRSRIRSAWPLCRAYSSIMCR